MTRQSSLSTDVLIVGAGPTGLLLANMLGKMGVETLLIEKQDDIVREPRAVSIDDESLRALQSAGLDQDVSDICVRGYGSMYRGPGGRVFASVKPFAKEFGFEKRNAFQQPEFVDLLRRALGRFDSVTNLFSTELTGFSQDTDCVTAEITMPDGTVRTTRARYLVACDGGRSFVRKSLGIKMVGSTFEEPWLIIDLESTRNRCFHTEVFCWPSRSCITLPGPGGIRRYEFKLNPGETAEQAETPQFVRKLLLSVGPDADEPVRRRQVYTFHARMAERWRDRRVFLAGDAAHLTPPFAGQGMNSGLRDAHNLAWKLHEALHSSTPDTLLCSYEQERPPHAWQMIMLAMRMGQVMMPSSRITGALIRGAFQALKIYRPARDYFAQMKYKPKPRFHDGLIWPDGRSRNSTLVGRMFPQPVVATRDDRRMLLDNVLPDQPVVLLFGTTPETMLSRKDLSALMKAGAAIIGITPEGVNPRQADFIILRDHSRMLSQPPYAAYQGQALLLRRDRYVAAAIATDNASQLLPHIRRIRAIQPPSDIAQCILEEEQLPVAK